MNTWKVGDKVTMKGREAVVIQVDEDDDNLPIRIEFEDGEQYWPWENEVTKLAPALPESLDELKALAARVAKAIEDAEAKTIKKGDIVAVEAQVTSDPLGPGANVEIIIFGLRQWLPSSLLTKVQQ